MPTKRRFRDTRRQRNALTCDQGLHLQFGWSIFERQPFASDEERRKAWLANRDRCMTFQPGHDFDAFADPREPGAFPAAYWDYEATEEERRAHEASQETLPDA